MTSAKCDASSSFKWEGISDTNTFTQNHLKKT